MKTVAEVIGVSRSNLMERMHARPKKRIGRRPLPDGKLAAEIKAIIAELPTYGYRRVHDHPQAPSAGGWLNAAQSQAGLPGDEASRRPTAPATSRFIRNGPITSSRSETT